MHVIGAPQPLHLRDGSRLAHEAAHDLVQRRAGRAIDLQPHINDFRTAGRINDPVIEIKRHVNSVERLLTAVDQVSTFEISPA